MSNETKRDVFEEVLDEWQVDETMPDANWKYPDFKLVRAKEKRFKDRYDAALPDDLPVIPEATGKFIKAMKANGDSLFASESTVLVMDYLDLIPFDALKITKWIDEHQNTIALAWLLGVWRVEETGEIVKLEAEE